MTGPARLDTWRNPSGPLVVAHRGDLHRAPENTMAAFRAAVDTGADAIELDVQLTGDGVPVVIHDEHVDRTTSGHGPVRAHTWRQLRQLDAGLWFDSRFRTERISALVDVLAWAADSQVRLLVELKTSPVFDKDAARVVADVIGAAATADVIVYASDHLLIDELATYLPDVPRGLIINERTTMTNEMLDGVGAALLSQSTWCLTPDTVEQTHAAGRLVIAEARHPADVPLLCSWGVDMIVTARTSLAELIGVLQHVGEVI